MHKTSLGKDVVKRFATSFWDVEVIDNSNKRGVDLVFLKDGVPSAYANVEVRRSWKTKDFPHLYLNVPVHKKKLLDNNDLPTYFFSVNEDGTAMFHCSAETIIESDEDIDAGEKFYKVPLHMLDYVVL